MRTIRWRTSLILLLSPAVLSACSDAAAYPQEPGGSAAPAVPMSAAASQTIAVSGTAVHYFSTAIIHSQETTGSTMVQRSTDIIRLSGDIDGYVLYHPTTLIDFAAGSLVNTGTQIFSGTVAGSVPVILRDDSFRFDVDLASGATSGEVHFGRSGDAPRGGGWYECDLVVTGTGVTADGDNVSDYTGTCTLRGSLK